MDKRVPLLGANSQSQDFFSQTDHQTTLIQFNRDKIAETEEILDETFEIIRKLFTDRFTPL